MTLRVDKNRCIGCGMCAAAVPEVFRVVEHVSTVLALPEPGIGHPEESRIDRFIG